PSWSRRLWRPGRPRATGPPAGGPPPAEGTTPSGTGPGRARRRGWPAAGDDGRPPAGPVTAEGGRQGGFPAQRGTAADRGHGAGAGENPDRARRGPVGRGGAVSRGAGGDLRGSRALCAAGTGRIRRAGRLGPDPGAGGGGAVQGGRQRGAAGGGARSGPD